MVPPLARWLLVLVLPSLPFFSPGAIPGSEAPAAGPNFLLDVSKEFVAAAAEQSIDRSDPVYDIILKTRISGTGRTIARVGVELVADDQAAVIDLITRGTLYAETVGVKGPVQLYSDSTIPFQIRQRVTLRPEGVLAGATCSHAEGQSTLTGVATDFRCLLDCLVKKIAYRQYFKNKEKADGIANRHAEERLNVSAQTEAGPKLQNADQSLKKNLAELRSQGIILAFLRFATSPETLIVRAQVAVPGQTGFGPPPTLQGRPYLALRVHEALVNETNRVNLAGKTYTGDELEKQAKKLGTDKTPKQSDDKEWSITFAKDKPIEVTFADQEVRAVIRLAEFTSGDNEYSSGMDVAVKYKFQPAGDKIKAVRQGPIEAFPPGFKPGQKLSAKQVGMRTVLQKRFVKVFKEELDLKDLELSQDLQNAGPLAATRVEANHGWLLITWRKATPKE